MLTKKARKALLAQYQAAVPYKPDPIGSIRQDIYAGAYGPDLVRCANGWYDVGAVKRMAKK